MTDLKLTDIEWLENLIEVFKDRMNEYTLQHIQQIKTKLEAWEVCKEFIVNLGGEYEMSIDNYYNVNEYQTLKKALEVEEE